MTFSAGDPGHVAEHNRVLGAPIAGAPAPTVAGPTEAATYITRFETGHGWTLDSGGTGTVTTVTDDNVLSANAIKLTANAAANNGPALRKSSLPAVDLATRTPVIWVKRLTSTGSLNVFLSDNSLTNYYYATVAPTVDNQWQAVPVLFGNTTLTGSLNRSTGVTRIHLTANGASGAAELLIGGVGTIPYPSNYPNGVVSITFDDSVVDGGTKGRAMLDAYGWGATAYVQMSTVDTNAGLTMQQLHDLESLNGWEISGHAFDDHPNLTELNAADLDAELFGMRNWLSSNGFRGRDHFAYPFGATNATVRAAAARYFSAARLVPAGPIHPTCVDDPMGLRALTWGSNVANLAAATAAIDKVKSSGGWGVFVFHGIDAASSGLTIAESEFAQILAYLDDESVAVEPVGKVLGFWS